MQYYYWGFGLRIKSEMELPELTFFPFSEKPDLIIEYGLVPTSLIKLVTAEKINTTVSATEYLQDLPPAKYYAANGNHIIIEPKANVDTASIRLFLLQNAMVAILYQQNKIPIHASAVYNNKGITLFAGNRGTGKSTLTTSLLLNKREYQLFSDDTCIVQQGAARNIELIPAYPALHLWATSMIDLSIASDKATALRKGLAKFIIHRRDDFTKHVLPLNQIFFIEEAFTGNKQQATASVINKHQSFQWLLMLCQHPFFLSAMKKKAINFNLINLLNEQATQKIKIVRPSQINSVKEITKLVEFNLQK